MKKNLLLLLVACTLMSLCLIFVSCDIDKPATSDSTTQSESNKTDAENESESNKTDVENEIKDPGIGGWRNFIVEYEALVDEYLIVKKKVEENPSDYKALAEQLTLIEKLGTMTDRMNEISAAFEAQSESGSYEYIAEMMEYSDELSRISQKMYGTEAETETE